MVLDWSRSTLSYRNGRVTLTRMELRLLLALLEHAPEPAPCQSLAQATPLWLDLLVKERPLVDAFGDQLVVLAEGAAIVGPPAVKSLAGAATGGFEQAVVQSFLVGTYA